VLSGVGSRLGRGSSGSKAQEAEGYLRSRVVNPPSLVSARSLTRLDIPECYWHYFTGTTVSDFIPRRAHAMDPRSKSVVGVVNSFKTYFASCNMLYSTFVCPVHDRRAINLPQQAQARDRAHMLTQIVRNRHFISKFWIPDLFPRCPTTSHRHHLPVLVVDAGQSTIPVRIR
jgi:hypothetical protein